MYRNLDLDLSSGTNERSAIYRQSARTKLGLVPFVPETAVEKAESIMRRLVVEYLEPPRIGS
jgi:hypothetical protein